MNRHPDTDQASEQAADHEEPIEARMARLERLVRGQQDVIARQQDRIEQLEGQQAVGAADGSDRVVRASSRRTLLKLGGAAAAAGVAAAAASALELAHPGTAHAQFDTFGLHGTASGAGNVGVEGDGTSGAIGVGGTSDTTFGVFAQSGSGSALLAQTTGGTGNGVVGNAIGGNGVVGNSNSAYGGSFQGGLAPLFLTPSSTLGGGPPSSGTHQRGELYVDVLGALWFCTTTSTPGTWVSLSAPPPPPPPTGLLNYLAAPIRIFDSRAGEPAPLPITKGALAGSSTTTIQVTGTDVGGIHVPAGATGAFGNLTVTNPVNFGDLILYPTGTTQPLASNINYGPNQTIANSFSVGLSSGGAMNLFVHVSGTDVIIDIAGYVK